jgi:tetratricopeptide (TPR) repeat protein
MNLNGAFKYAAFISYNHRDRDEAMRLHRTLESYRIPRSLLQKNPEFNARLGPIFLDRQELASSADLALSVREALEDSAYLIVICSPNAVASRWVNEEISFFIKSGRANKILCVVVDGVPAPPARDARGMLVADQPAQACFPLALLSNDDGSARPEPLAADIRSNADGRTDAHLKTIAGLLELPFDSLKRREIQRRQKQLTTIIAATSAGLILTTSLAVYAWIARNEAQQQRLIAEAKSITAQRTVDFFKEMFANADPQQSRGESVTVREVIDRGALQIRSRLETQPQVRAELLITLGEVYTSLGLYKSASSILDETKKLPSLAGSSQRRANIAAGELALQTSQYELALDLHAKAINPALTQSKDDLLLNIAAQIGVANSLSALGKTNEARPLFISTLAAIPKGPDFDSIRAYSLIAQGTNEYYGNDHKQSVAYLNQALLLRKQLVGENDLQVTLILNLLGVIAHDARDTVTAEKYYLEVVNIFVKLYGENGSNVAIAQSNLGRVLLERREFSSANQVLLQSVNVIRKQIASEHDALIFPLSNLGMAQRGLGIDQLASESLLEALMLAKKFKHRAVAPIMTDLAEIDCRNQRIEDGLLKLVEAEPIMRTTYPNDPWRTSYLKHIKAYCNLVATRQSQAAQAVVDSAPDILERWGQNNLYGYETTSRLSVARQALTIATKGAK